jgi:hypothetical protein
MDCRGATTVVEYAIVIGIATILLVLLTTAAADTIDTETSIQATEQGELLGEAIVGDVEQIDRQISYSSPTQQLTTAQQYSYPSQIAGSGYTVTITQSSVTVDPGPGGTQSTYTTTHDASVPISNSTVYGGPIAFEWNGTHLKAVAASQRTTTTQATTPVDIVSYTQQDTVSPGNTVTATATLETQDSTGATVPVAVTVNGVERHKEIVDVPAEGTTDLPINWKTSPTSTGTGQVRVTTPTDTQTRNISITSSNQVEPQITAVTAPDAEGGEGTLTANVTNTGTSTVTERVILTASERVVATDAVTLSANESTTVDLTWTTTDGSAGQQRLSVVASGGTASTVISISAGPYPEYVPTISDITSPVTTGDPVTIDAVISNEGSTNAPRPATLRIKDKKVDGERIQLDPDTSTSQRFEWDTTGVQQGTYEATLSTPSQTVSTDVVVNTPQQPQTTVDIVDVTDPAIVGQPASITIEVTNTGSETTRQVLRATAASQNISRTTVAGKTIVINSGETTTETLEWEPPANSNGNTVTLTANTTDAGDTTTITVAES